MPESVGRQSLSIRPSSARAVFGTASRDDQRLARAAAGPSPVDHQGWVTAPIGEGDASAASRFVTSPRVKFGSGARDGMSRSGAAGRQTPGPGEYAVPGGLGPQPVSVRATSPRAIFGTSQRDSGAPRATRNVPGPGAYAVPAAVGKQTVSTRPSSPAYSWGTGPRDARGAGGGEVPGPGAYVVPSTLGGSPQSTVANSPRFKFGSGARDSGHHADSGPGFSYALPDPGIGSPHGSRSPTWRFGSSNRFDARFDTGVPGPGQYTAPPGVHGPAWSLKSR